MLYPAELRRHNTYIIPKKKGLAPYFSFLKDLNENKLETEIIEDSYIHSSTSKNRKLNSNKN